MNPNPPTTDAPPPPSEPLGDGLLTAQEVQDLTLEEMETMMQGLSREDLANLEAKFASVDRDSNGTIDPYEMHRYLSKKWRRELPQGLITNIVKYADVDKDGRVNFKEFVRLQLKCLPKFRGYCQTCSKVIVGLDGWFCPSCDPFHQEGMKKSFALCLGCYSKNDRIQHEHSYEQFIRFKITSLGKDGVQELLRTRGCGEHLMLFLSSIVACMIGGGDKKNKQKRS
ncbi:hypothetical protein BSKO_03239 [Bryopsis sp. KO-2023]|nr:hypothetical protein BSKO_03239 [Bryopsis sp. KO-2023]